MQPVYSPSPDRIANSHIERFRLQFQNTLQTSLPDYQALHQASIDKSEIFWREIWDFCDVIGEPGDIVLEPGSDAETLSGSKWFPNASLNFAENLLREPTSELAIQFRGEDKAASQLTRAELHSMVSRTAQALISVGVEPGDRVAGYLPNMPQSVVAMLAATSIGAVWSSCSPDFGVQGVVDRFEQIQPKVLFAVDGYFYKGQTHECLSKVCDITEQLPTLEKVIVVPYINSVEGAPSGSITLEQFIGPYENKKQVFQRFPFDHPLYILFSSGTTGTPKAIVHGAGGTLLQHLKEHQLHTDIQPQDPVFYFTTCGWMMWNWLVTSLASGASLALYDGSPFHPNQEVLFDYAEETKCKVFGTSAKYLEEANKVGLAPQTTHNLDAMQVMLSTGSPLAAEGYDFVFEKVKADLQLSSISGGTDIVSCFVLGCPVLPVYRGEIQCAGLGMAIEVWDDNGNRLEEEKGELVCVKPFPSMPISFWNDSNGEKYRAAYFERFPGVWHHGDYAASTEYQGYVIYGRSDAVLNPGGVRIGTAEIYRQVDLVEEVLESIVIGQSWQGDVRVVLFVKLRESYSLDATLVDKIRKQIRANTTPRHVPAKVIAVADIPRTRSGKLVEIAVRDVVHGKSIGNREAIANPEALALFQDLEELRTE